MRIELRHLSLACVLLTVAVPALAQGVSPQSPAANANPAVELDFRLGSIWPEDSVESNPSFGGRVGLFLLGGERSNRISLQFTGDYRALGHERVFYDDVPDALRSNTSVFTFGGAVGYDLVRTASLTLDIRGGAMMVRNSRSLEIRARAGAVPDDDVWDPVCHFQGFSADCQSDYKVAGTIAFGVRRYFGSLGDFYVGADYTRILNSHNILVGAVGVRLR